MFANWRRPKEINRPSDALSLKDYFDRTVRDIVRINKDAQFEHPSWLYFDGTNEQSVGKRLMSVGMEYARLSCGVLGEEEGVIRYCEETRQEYGIPEHKVVVYKPGDVRSLNYR